MSDEQKANLVYITIAAALDLHATPDEIKSMFRPKVIDVVISIIQKRQGKGEQS